MGEALYDTSVLVELQRRGVRELRGYTTILNVVEYPKVLRIRGLKVIYPDVRDHNLALVISKDLYKLGKPVPAIDVVVAAVAVNRGLKLIASDRHFEYVREVRRDLVLEVPAERSDSRGGSTDETGGGLA